MKERMGSLNKNTVFMACKHFMTRIEALVEADGDFIKENDSQQVFIHIF
jgi:hypothetical protein